MRIFSAFCAIALLAGCVSYQGDTTRPGQMVSSASTLPPVGFWPNGVIYSYETVRVIVPPEVRRCRVAGFMSQQRRLDEGRPNAAGEALVTIMYGRQRARIVCERRGADLERSIDRVRTGDHTWRDGSTTVFYAFPPLVHMNTGDGGAPARWEAFRAEYCGGDLSRDPRRERACAAEIFAALRRVDIGA